MNRYSPGRAGQKSVMVRAGAMLLCLMCSIAPAHSQIRLPKLIQSGMVLQRDASVRVWGWASKNERITLRFLDSTYTTDADSTGNWSVRLAPAAAGGPHLLKIFGRDTVVLSDIFTGDVWLCSGQSNMELPMRRVAPVYPREIEESSNAFIRCFTVPQRYNFCEQQRDVDSGAWMQATPQNVLSFSAVAYFFAKSLFERYRVPIGLINSSLGGSPAESWMSDDALKSFPPYRAEAQKWKDSALVAATINGDRIRIGAWYDRLRRTDAGYKNPAKPWSAVNVRTSDWKSMSVPGIWTTTELAGVNGSVWFRRSVRVPDLLAGRSAVLVLGRIIDADSVYVNGRFVGTTGYQYPPRRYAIPEKLLRGGMNSIAVRIISNNGTGGFVPDKPYVLIVDGDSIDLKGKWKYRIGAVMPPLAGETFIRWKPEGLFNGMIAPLRFYRIKGVIWYQGESNVDRPEEYRTLFPALIRDWRQTWSQGDFPFLFVQLPNFMEAKSYPAESNWAMLREAQREALSVPNTGMAVTIDIGEWNDIHPVDKKDVGARLALAARKLAYGEDSLTASGPSVRSVVVAGNRIIVSFDNVGTGLIARGGGPLDGFAIAGSNKKFIWARAAIQGKSVVVWNESIKSPIAVRYAWADNPAGANLYNSEGLPASPFQSEP